jgi:hypothetical protein
MRRMDTESAAEDFGRLPRPELLRVENLLDIVTAALEPTRHALGVLAPGNGQRALRIIDGAGRLAMANEKDPLPIGHGSPPIAQTRVSVTATRLSTTDLGAKGEFTVVHQIPLHDVFRW